MARTAQDVGELVGRAFDRLEHQFPGAEIEDAVLVVELCDDTDTEPDDGTGREVPATVAILESTTDRCTVHEGILHFALRNISGQSREDDD